MFLLFEKINGTTLFLSSLHSVKHLICNINFEEERIRNAKMRKCGNWNHVLV